MGSGINILTPLLLLGWSFRKQIYEEDSDCQERESLRKGAKREKLQGEEGHSNAVWTLAQSILAKREGWDSSLPFPAKLW